jgi:hypothetical protein
MGYDSIMLSGGGDIKSVCSGVGALLGSAVGPFGILIGGFLGGLVGEILVERTADFSVEQARRLLNRLRPLRNADLERAAIDALRSALRDAKRELQNQTDSSTLPRGLSPDEEELFRRWDGQLERILRMTDEQLLAATGDMPPDAPTLTTMTPVALADALLAQLQQLAQPHAIPPSLQAFLKARLPELFRHQFTQVLKDPKHQRAWIAFQKQLLEAIFQSIGKTDEQISHLRTLFEERIIKQQDEILSLLEAEPAQWEERADALAKQITEPILQAVGAMQQRLDYIVDLLGEKHRYRLLHEATLQFLNSYMQEVFVGRGEILGALEQFFAERRSGLAVVHAPAGYGKTRLMMRLLTRLQARGDTKTVYHFFTNHEALQGLGTRVEYAYAHLTLQLGSLMNRRIDLPDANPDELRAALYYQLKELRYEQKPLVILIDGLDEADEAIRHLPLPEPLPDGVFVIVSARWDGQPEPPPYLEAWHKRADREFPLERLSENDLREWLARDEQLRPYADDDEFVRRLHQRTEGLPLYARFLIDDLKNAPNPRQKLNDVPQGIQNYIRQQVQQLAEHVPNAQGMRQMFALLTVVKGALPESDLRKLCDLSVFDLASLPQAIRRWFLHSEAGWQFQHPRLADGFRRALDGDAEQMEQRLLEYCARWCTHMSRYALRYYAAHLAKRAIKDTDSAKQLYALMEDEAFLQAQREAFPDEPELPLSLLQGAIEAASARDEPVPLANALLLHAQRAQGFRRQSPYRIWRETGNLRYALKVADLYHPQVRPIWYLLLASEYSDPNQRKDILNRLPRSFTRLRDCLAFPTRYPTHQPPNTCPLYPTRLHLT